MSTSHSAPMKQVLCRMCGGAATDPVADIDGYRYVECQGCGFTFIPAFTPEKAQAFYAAAMEGVPQTGWAPSLEFLAPVRSVLDRTQPQRILDFGSGNSYLPDRLRKDGHRVIAVDLRPPRRPHPDRLTGDLLTMDLAPAQFDLIYAFQVFEHLPEPRPYLAELLRLAKPGSLVLIHTDMEPPDRREPLSEWDYVCPPHHCSLFRHRTFEVVLADQPHELVWRDPCSVVIRTR